jgi:hypothetical protein
MFLEECIRILPSYSIMHVSSVHHTNGHYKFVVCQLKSNQYITPQKIGVWQPQIFNPKCNEMEAQR